MLTRADDVPFDPAESDPEAAVVDGIIRMVGQRDPITAAHVEAVGMLAHRLAAELGFSSQTIRRITLGARLHDVGKHAIPMRILRKASPLDEDEWQAVRLHPHFGASIVVGFPFLRPYEAIVRAHHERVDGTGYPDGLMGDRIPYEARMIAVVDAFHAMTVARPYAPVRAPHDALDELVRCAGTQFDTDFVDAFVRMMGRRGRTERRLRSA